MTSVFWILFLIALGFALVEMTVTFVLARRWQNYGIVDVVWSGGFALIALLGFLMSTVFGYLMPPLPNITPSVVVRWGLLTLMVIPTGGWHDDHPIQPISHRTSYRGSRSLRGR